MRSEQLSTRGWDLTTVEDGQIRWHMTDLVGAEIGEYVCSFNQFRELVLALHQRVITLMQEQDVEVLEWPDWNTESPRPYYGTLDELERNREAIRSLELS